MTDTVLFSSAITFSGTLRRISEPETDSSSWTKYTLPFSSDARYPIPASVSSSISSLHTRVSFPADV